MSQNTEYEENLEAALSLAIDALRFYADKRNYAGMRPWVNHVGFVIAQDALDKIEKLRK